MALANCPDCGALFVDNGAGLCPACIAKEEAAIQQCNEVLREGEVADVASLANKTGIEERLILRLLHKGRLLAQSSAPLQYPCANCGKPITQGKWCSTCAQKLQLASRSQGTASTQARRRANAFHFYSKSDPDDR
ncbi:MAG: flagellar protein [Firmicutes bacterium]|nr:flagellar protein [Bacillota bacterium]